MKGLLDERGGKSIASRRYSDSAKSRLLACEREDDLRGDRRNFKRLFQPQNQRRLLTGRLQTDRYGRLPADTLLCRVVYSNLTHHRHCSPSTVSLAVAERLSASSFSFRRSVCGASRRLFVTKAGDFSFCTCRFPPQSSQPVAQFWSCHPPAVQTFTRVLLSTTSRPILDALIQCLRPIPLPISKSWAKLSQALLARCRINQAKRRTLPKQAAQVA